MASGSLRVRVLPQGQRSRRALVGQRGLPVLPVRERAVLAPAPPQGGQRGRPQRGRPGLWLTARGRKGQQE